MTNIDFRHTIAARRRARGAGEAHGRSGARERHFGTALERRIENVRSAARNAGYGSRSRTANQVPKA